MVAKFKNPPLIELSAEIRWARSGAVNPAEPQIPGMAGLTSRDEEFFMRFGAKAAADGYSRFERTVPPGFPLPLFQAVYRFRKLPSESGTTIYQIGPGVFVANITPPYDSWESFRPVVKRGTEFLVETRSEEERASPFTSVSLRYIDSFRKEFIGDLSFEKFLRTMLGFSVELPPALQSEVTNREHIKYVLQLVIPLKSDQQMRVNLGEGFINNEPSLIMDTVVTSVNHIAPNVDDIMTALDAAHDVQRRTFVEMSRNLHDAMKPIG